MKGTPSVTICQNWPCGMIGVGEHTQTVQGPWVLPTWRQCCPKYNYTYYTYLPACVDMQDFLSLLFSCALFSLQHVRLLSCNFALLAWQQEVTNSCSAAIIQTL